MGKIIAIILSVVFSLTLGCSTKESNSMPEKEASAQTTSREKVRQSIKRHHLEIIYYGEGRWPSNYVNLSVEEKLKIQIKTMESIRNGQGFEPIPLTKDQVNQLDREGHFSSIYKSDKIKRNFTE